MIQFTSIDANRLTERAKTAMEKCEKLKELIRKQYMQEEQQAKQALVRSSMISRRIILFFLASA
jgi:hypothetical protein